MSKWGRENRLGTGVALTCVATLLAVCGETGTTIPTGGGGDEGGSGGGVPIPTEEAPEVPAGPRTITVEIRGIAYNAPGGGDFVTIGLGERVRWVNLDGTIHSATSTEVPSGGKSFDSGPLGPGAEFTFTPRVVGTYTYSCRHYPDRMANARIRVVD